MKPRRPRTVPPERVLPHDADAERCVVGSVILDETLLDDVAAVVGPSDFYLEGVGVLFGRLIVMAAEGLPFEAALIVAQLKAHGEWVELNQPTLTPQVDAAMIAECCHAVGTAGHACYYAEIVADMSFRRRVIRALEVVSLRAFDVKVPVKELRGAALKLLRKIANGGHNGEQDQEVKVAVPAAMPRRTSLGQGQTPLPQAAPASQLHPYQPAGRGTN